MTFYLEVVSPDNWETNWHRQIQERIYIMLKISNNSLNGIVLGKNVVENLSKKSKIHGNRKDLNNGPAKTSNWFNC